MKIEFPNFKNRLLVGICEELVQRSKSLNYGAAVSFETETSADGLEEVRLSISSPYTPYLDLRLIALSPLADLFMNLFLRSEKRRNRGQALFSLRDAPVSADPQQFVELLEWTVGIRAQVGDPMVVVGLKATWRQFLAQ
ncbi:MAG: hypothetical protein JKY65_33420 [Planctomycetes bacterium]|nr:hypothetical protein [Planctomycetota bacterium]